MYVVAVWSNAALGDDGVVTTRTRTYEWTLWCVAASCALHPLEEYFTGWQVWARQSLGIVMSTELFVVANTVLVVAAFLFARAGWRHPVRNLVIPAATLVNAIGFHIIPSIAERRVAPGLYTAVLLYVPFSSFALGGAAHDGVHRRDIAIACLAGSVVAIGFVLLVRSLSD